MKKLLTILILLSLTTQLIAQIDNECDSIADSESLDSEPQYGEGLKDIMNFATQKLTPILSESMKQSGLIPTEMIAELTISRDGGVVDIDFIDLNVTEEYKSKVRAAIQRMKWKPAVKDDQSVCATYFWNIRCFKWG
ncbi:MAG: hypothetical protein WBA23_20585 [Tunicatimonas sp.]|uniref:hypothetical protein n=1 Tax=Tunicatimonas sp. TaxID=1940096 RepID=UPI003C7632E0